MEDWRIKLALIEKELGSHEKYCWKEAIATLQELYVQYTDNAEVNVRIIYIVFHLLTEEKITDEERDVLGDMLVKYFKETYQIFQNNAEYLFFVSMIMNVAEWIWGTDDYLKTHRKDTLYFAMSQRASVLEPDNKVYLWGKSVYIEKNSEEDYLLVKEILFGTNCYLSWLQKKGFAGAYIINWLINSYKWLYDHYVRHRKRYKIETWILKQLS